MEFNEHRQSAPDQITLNVHEYTPEVFETMIRYLYLGESNVNSNDLVDLLNLCQEYLLPGMKQAIEHVFAEQLTLDLFVDVYMLTKAFDCRFLKDRLVAFGATNIADLRRRALLSQIDREDQLAIIRASKTK